MLVGPSKYLKQIIQIEFNWIPTGRKQTSWLFTSMAEDLNSGLPWTNPASGQGGTSELQVQRRNHSATLPNFQNSQ